MLKKKPLKKQSYANELRKLVRFQNEASLLFQVHWLNPQNQICKVIQGQHYCFCGHFLEHHFCSKGSNIDKCTADRCKCERFYFVPDLNLKCICKHAPYRHQLTTRKCKQCANCIGFLTEWVCQCGYRFQQHFTEAQTQKENNFSVNLDQTKLSAANGNTSLPRLRQTLRVQYSGQDRVKELASQSLVKLRVDSSLVKMISNKQTSPESYLTEKLRQANLRYFSKFKDLTETNKEESESQNHQTSGLGLYLQPHYFRNCSLTCHILGVNKL